MDVLEYSEIQSENRGTMVSEKNHNVRAPDTQILRTPYT